MGFSINMDKGLTSAVADVARSFGLYLKSLARKAAENRSWEPVDGEEDINLLPEANRDAYRAKQIEMINARQNLALAKIRADIAEQEARKRLEERKGTSTYNNSQHRPQHQTQQGDKNVRPLPGARRDSKKQLKEGNMEADTENKPFNGIKGMEQVAATATAQK